MAATPTTATTTAAVGTGLERRSAKVTDMHSPRGRKLRADSVLPHDLVRKFAAFRDRVRHCGHSAGSAQRRWRHANRRIFERMWTRVAKEAPSTPRILTPSRPWL